jgi:membrane-associated HD superfamily phosphohydrolase
MFFYERAIKQHGGDKVNLSDFKYIGTKPHTAEAAIVMLADTIEATTRSLPNPDKQMISETIKKMIKERLEDGQLDDSNLTFRDLHIISNEFINVLAGAFHERIEYPHPVEDDIKEGSNKEATDKEIDDSNIHDHNESEITDSTIDA